MPSRRHSWQLDAEDTKVKQTGDIEAQNIGHESSPQSRSRALAALQGPLTLTSVALLWGTYGPTLRLLYALPGPPHPAALTTARSIIQVLPQLPRSPSLLTENGGDHVYSLYTHMPAYGI